MTTDEIKGWAGTRGEFLSAKFHERGLYLNDGSMTIRTEDVAVCSVLAIDEPKRGKGSEHKDPERDANALLFANAKKFALFAQRVAELSSQSDLREEARELLKSITSPESQS